MNLIAHVSAEDKVRVVVDGIGGPNRFYDREEKICEIMDLI